MPSDSAKLARPGRLPGIAYPPSKTALNMTTVQYAKAFPAMRINAVAPVFTKTALNAASAARASTGEPGSSRAWRKSPPR